MTERAIRQRRPHISAGAPNGRAEIERIQSTTRFTPIVMMAMAMAGQSGASRPKLIAGVLSRTMPPQSA